MRRSPGSLCGGTWKAEKELPSDGLFSEDKRRDKTRRLQKQSNKKIHCIHSCLLSETFTSWPDRPHQPVHLDVPVFDVGARLAKFPLSSLSETESRTENG